ncbi:hypothetical protein ACWEPH_00620, partial [Nocardia beijingensis]
DGNLKVMPLEDLHGDGKHYATRFVDVTAAPSGLLTLENRIATLTNLGIYVLQQRLVKHYTRFTIDLPALRKQAAAVLEEAEQEREWIEIILDDEEPTMESVRRASKEFDGWLSEGNPSRRELLRKDENHADIRRQSRAEAKRRRRA